MSTQSTTVARVNNLIALSASDSPQEARTAALKACQLIREHGLEVQPKGSHHQALQDELLRQYLRTVTPVPKPKARNGRYWWVTGLGIGFGLTLVTCNFILSAAAEDQKEEAAALTKSRENWRRWSSAFLDGQKSVCNDTTACLDRWPFCSEREPAYQCNVGIGGNIRTIVCRSSGCKRDDYEDKKEPAP